MPISAFSDEGYNKGRRPSQGAQLAVYIIRVGI